MQDNYIINRVILFCPDTKLLQSYSGQKHEAALTGPASLCLKLLIENHPNIVHQNEFYPYVWGDNSITTTANTLYQNISLVRRAMNNVSEDSGKLIITIPRKGFQLEKNTAIERVSHEIKNLINDSSCEVVASVASVTSEKKVNPFKFYISKQKDLLENIFLVLALVSLLYFSLPFEQQSSKNYFSDYTLLTTKEGCHFYAKNNAHSYDYHNKIVEEQAFNCTNYPWVYITAYDNIRPFTYISCQKNINQEKNAKCVTHYPNDDLK